MPHAPSIAGSAATLADFTSARAPEALEGHAFAVGWKRGTLWTAYWCRRRGSTCASGAGSATLSLRARGGTPSCG
eukprot:2033385-Prymnesium_polylepis.1